MDEALKLERAKEAARPRICAYCLLDHEVHGGCFTGKKPSEIRQEMADPVRRAKGEKR